MKRNESEATEKDKYWGIGEKKEVIKKKGAGMREKTSESGGAGKSGQMRESRVRRID